MFDLNQHFYVIFHLMVLDDYYMSPKDNTFSVLHNTDFRRFCLTPTCQPSAE